MHNRLLLDIICLLTWKLLGRDHERFSQVADHANVCPLVPGAIAGSTLPLDRAFTAKVLGFVDQSGEPMNYGKRNGCGCGSGISFLEFAMACVNCSLHLSSLAEDVILWNSSEFGFIQLPDSPLPRDLL